jgi:hypothetical protein
MMNPADTTRLASSQTARRLRLHAHRPEVALRQRSSATDYILRNIDRWKAHGRLHLGDETLRVTYRHLMTLSRLMRKQGLKKRCSTPCVT